MLVHHAPHSKAGHRLCLNVSTAATLSVVLCWHIFAALLFTCTSTFSINRLCCHMTGRRFDTRNLYAGAPMKAVTAQSTLGRSQVHQSSKVDSKAQRRQAGMRQKRSRSDQGHCQGSVPAIKSKKVRFTEPAKDTGSVHPALRSAPKPQQHPTASHPRSSSTAPAGLHSSRSCRKEPTASAPDQGRQCSFEKAQDSAAGEGSQTAHNPAIAARTRAAGRAQTTACLKEPTTSAPDEADQCLDICKQLNAASRSKAAAKGATETTTNTCTRRNKKQPTASGAQQAGDCVGAHAPEPTEISRTARQEPVAARTRAASRAAAVAAGRSKRKEPSTAASDEEERGPAAKRARAGKAGADVPSNAVCSGTATACTKKRSGRPVKRNQQPARAESGLAQERLAGLNEMH